MYDEAKEKKEQMDDFRVEVRNFTIIFVLIASSLSSESNSSNSFVRTISSTFLNIRSKEFVP